MYRRLSLPIMILFLAASSAWGQSPSPPDQSEQIRILLERVQQLEKRVSDLETRQTPAATITLAAAKLSSPPAPDAIEAAVTPAPVAGHQQEGHNEQATVQQSVQQMETHYPSLQIRGFGDVDFSATDQKGTNSGFNLGQLDLHLASALSRKVTYFGEITFNAQPTGYTVEVERSIIRYDFNDYFKISFGRYHTPIGYWNTAFHHGAWLQTTIIRPEMEKIGGTFIPVHFVGFLAEGNIPSGGAGLSYNAGVGNGRGDIISRPGDAGDNNDNRAWVANLYSRPVKLYGLQLGASIYRDKVKGGKWIELPRVDFIRSCGLDQGKPGSPGGILQCEPPQYSYQRGHQQSGILRSGRLPAALVRKIAQAVLPLRVHTHAAERTSLHQSGPVGVDSWFEV